MVEDYWLAPWHHTNSCLVWDPNQPPAHFWTGSNHCLTGLLHSFSSVQTIRTTDRLFSVLYMLYWKRNMIWVVGMDQYIIHDTVLYTLRESLMCICSTHVCAHTHNTYYSSCSLLGLTLSAKPQTTRSVHYTITALCIRVYIFICMCTCVCAYV